MFAFVVFIFIFQLSQEIGWKERSKMTYFESGGTQNLNWINQTILFHYTSYESGIA